MEPAKRQAPETQKKGQPPPPVVPPPPPAADKECTQCHELTPHSTALTCPQKHTCSLCNSCLLEHPSCPTCSTPFVLSRAVRTNVRGLSLERCKKEIVTVMASTALLAQRYNSDEIRQLYQNSMFDTCEKLREQFVSNLKEEISHIVNGKFLMESEDDQQDLKTIDQYLKIMNGKDADGEEENEFNSLIKALNQYVQKKILNKLLNNPNVVIVNAQ